MKKPNNYDTTQASGAYERPLPGGHQLIILQVSETTTRDGRPMIIVSFDFAANDRQAGYFKRAFADDIRPNKKWPRRGTEYITQIGRDGNTTRKFKTFCTCYEKSNDAAINWCEDSATWCSQFKNKRIGGTFGVVHDVYQGKEISPVQLRWFTTTDRVDPENIPDEVGLSEDQRTAIATSGGAAQAGANDFMDIPDGAGEELPFN